MGALLLFLNIKGAQLLQNSWFSSGVYRLFKLSQRLPYTPIYIAMFVLYYTSDTFLVYSAICHLSVSVLSCKTCLHLYIAEGLGLRAFNNSPRTFYISRSIVVFVKRFENCPLFVPECRYSHHLQLKVAK